MKYAKLKNTEINASKIVLGTALFGTEISEKESFELLDFFFEQGGNAVDTANCYADWLSKEKQMSEKTIGKWLLESGFLAVWICRPGELQIGTCLRRVCFRCQKFSCTYFVKTSVLLRIFLKNPKLCCGYFRKIRSSNANI